MHSPDYSELILGQMKKVIQEVGPISRSLLAKRILQAWGITRLGTRLDQRFTELLVKLKTQSTETDGMVFFWSEEVNPAEYGAFRVSSYESQRRSPEEVAAAVKSVLASQINLPYGELIKQVVKILGYARSGSALDRAIKSGIQKAIELEFVVMDENQRVIAR